MSKAEQYADKLDSVAEVYEGSGKPKKAAKHRAKAAKIRARAAKTQAVNERFEDAKQSVQAHVDEQQQVVDTLKTDPGPEPEPEHEAADNTEQLTAGRFSVTVSDNHGTSGVGVTEAFKFRYTITDRQTGTIQKTGYATSQREAQTRGRKYAGKIAQGKRTHR